MPCLTTPVLYCPYSILITYAQRAQRCCFNLWLLSSC